jgi:hypothetical protein
MIQRIKEEQLKRRFSLSAFVLLPGTRVHINDVATIGDDGREGHFMSLLYLLVAIGVKTSDSRPFRRSSTEVISNVSIFFVRNGAIRSFEDTRGRAGVQFSPNDV